MAKFLDKLIVFFAISLTSLILSSCGEPEGDGGSTALKQAPDGIYAGARPSICNNGTAVLFAGTKNGKSNIYQMDIDGKRVKKILTTRSNLLSPVYNNNETKIAFVIDTSNDGRGIIAICNPDGSRMERITKNQSSNEIYDRNPTFTRDGNSIVFQRSNKHAFIQEFFKINLKTLQEEKIMDAIAWHPTAQVITSDNQYMLFGQMIKMSFKGNKKIFPYRIYEYNFNTKKLKSVGLLGRNNPAISSDNKNIIYTGTDDAAIFISDRAGKGQRRLFYSEYKCKSPLYSKDNRNVIFLHFKEKWSARATITILHVITQSTKEVIPEWK